MPFLRLSEETWQRIFDALSALQDPNYPVWSSHSHYPVNRPARKACTRTLQIAYDIVSRGRANMSALAPLASTCKAMRELALPQLYSYVHLGRQQSIYTVRAHLELDSSWSIFYKTRTLSLPVWSAPFFAEHLKIVQDMMPELRHLFVRLHWTKDTPALADYRAAFVALSVCLRSPKVALTFLSIHFAPPFQPPPAQDLIGMMTSWSALPLQRNVDVLDFRPNFMLVLSPDASGTVATPLVFLPPFSSVREVRLSITDFALCHMDNWRHQPRLARVCLDRWLEDGAGVSHARFIAALREVIPFWRTTVTVLQLFDMVFDKRAALALAELVALEHLDIHPSTLKVGQEPSLADTADPNVIIGHGRLVLRDVGMPRTLRIAGGPPGLVKPGFRDLVAAYADELFRLLLFCLPALDRLRVTHLGPRGPGEHFTEHVSWDKLQDYDHISCRLVAICPSLRLMYFGAHVSHSSHVHVPSVQCLCHDFAADEPYASTQCCYAAADLCKKCIYHF